MYSRFKLKFTYNGTRSNGNQSTTGDYFLTSSQKQKSISENISNIDDFATIRLYAIKLRWLFNLSVR